MIASVVYLLCAVTSVLCTTLLSLKYRRTRVPLLFWSSVCFAGFAVGNVLLFVDLVLLPTSTNLLIFRTVPTFFGLCCLIWGLVWENA